MSRISRYSALTSLIALCAAAHADNTFVVTPDPGLPAISQSAAAEPLPPARVPTFASLTGLDFRSISNDEFVAQVAKFGNADERDRVVERFNLEARKNHHLTEAFNRQLDDFKRFTPAVQRAGLPVAAMRAFARMVVLVNAAATPAPAVARVDYAAPTKDASDAATPTPPAAVPALSKPAPVSAQAPTSAASAEEAVPPPKKLAAAPATIPGVLTPPNRVERPTLSQPLPGLGKLPGIALLKNVSNVVHIGTDLSEVVPVSRNFPNRISTPFTAPQATKKRGEVDVEQLGTSLMVTMNVDTPTAIYVRDADQPSGPVVSLTLVPQDIAPQTILLMLDAVPDVKAEAAAPSSPHESSYEGRLVALLRQVAIGLTPSGFAKAPLPSAVGKMDALLVAPQTRWSGREMDIFAYRIENATEAAVDLDESVFYQDGVRAIGLLDTRLGPHESTTLYVIAEKAAVQ